MKNETHRCKVAVTAAPPPDLRVSIAPRGRQERFGMSSTPATERYWRFAFFVVFAALLGTLPARAQTSSSNMGGDWNGQYSMTDHCDHGGTYSYFGTATATFEQAGTSVTGNITFQNVAGTDGIDCTTRRAPTTPTIGVSGIVTGGSFMGALFTGTGINPPLSLSGPVGSTFMTLSFAGGTTSATITLTSTGTPAQVDPMGGSWNGQYVMTDHCDHGGTYSYFGTATAAFEQAGTSVTGNITFQNVAGTDGIDCTTRRAPTTPTIGVSGIVTGGSFAGKAFADVLLSLSGPVGSTSMTLSWPSSPTTSATITLTKQVIRHRAARH